MLGSWQSHVRGPRTTLCVCGSKSLSTVSWIITKVDAEGLADPQALGVAPPPAVWHGSPTLCVAGHEGGWEGCSPPTAKLNAGLSLVSLQKSEASCVARKHTDSSMKAATL